MLRAVTRRLFASSDETLKAMCKAATAESFQNSLKTMRSPIGWELAQTLEDTEVYRNTKFTDSHVYRRQGKIDCPPMKIISYVRNPANTRSWNEPIIEAKVLKNLGEYSILYHKVTMPWPMSIREIVFADTLQTLENGTAYVMASIDYEGAPVHTSAVRSVLNWGMILAEESENDPEKSFVTYISSWQLKEETLSLREANYLVQKRNPFILKLRKLLLD